MNEKDYERKYYASLLSCNNEKKFHELLMNNDFTGNNEGQVLKCPESEKTKEVPIGTMMPNYEDGSIYAKTDKGWINLNDSLSEKEVIADVPRGTLSNSDEEIKVELPAGDENKFYKSLKEEESEKKESEEKVYTSFVLTTFPDGSISAEEIKVKLPNWQDFDISEVENSELLRTREKLTKLENSAIKAFAGFEISYQRFVVLLVCAKISKLVMEKGRSLAAAISKIAKFSIRNVSEHLHLLSENGYLEKADLKVQDKVIWGYNLTEKGEKILDLGLITWRKINVTDHL